MGEHGELVVLGGLVLAALGAIAVAIVGLLRSGRSVPPFAGESAHRARRRWRGLFGLRPSRAGR